MKNLIIVALVMFVVASLSSCSSTQQCWAYRDVQHYSKKNKKSPSRVAAKCYFNKKGARVSTYAY